MKREQVLEAVKQVEKEGLLPPGGADRAGARLAEILVPERDVARSAAAVIAWLGGILVAGSLLLTIALNWEELGKGAKLGLVFTTLAGLYVAGYRLGVEPGNRPAVGVALTGAAMLGFGGAIGLVAQIYHLSGSPALTLLVWWAFTLPVALAVNSRKLLVVPLALFLTWAHLRTEEWLEARGIHQWLFGDASILAHSLLTLGLGGLLAAFGALARGSRLDPLAGPLAFLGRLGALVGLSMLGFEEISDSTRLHAGADPPLFGEERLQLLRTIVTPAALAGLGAIVAGGLALARRATASLRRTEIEDAGAALLCAVVLAASLLIGPPATVVLANAMLLAAVVLMVMRGVSRQQRSDVNLAVIVFLVAAMCRYFEFVTDALGPVGFLGAGILLIALGAFLERKRRAWTARPTGSSP